MTTEFQEILNNLTKKWEDSDLDGKYDIENWIKLYWIIADDSKKEESERQKQINEWVEAYESTTELDNAFNNEFGQHEIGDRIDLATAHWEENILNHPCILFDDTAYKMAQVINVLQNELYNEVWKTEK